MAIIGEGAIKGLIKRACGAIKELTSVCSRHNISCSLAFKISGAYSYEEPWSIYIKQKKNQVFKLLPLKEENGKWELQLDTLLIELGGLNRETPTQDAIALTIIAKLSGLRDKELDFFLYRKTIFEVISLLEEW